MASRRPAASSVLLPAAGESGLLGEWLVVAGVRPLGAHLTEMSGKI